MSAPGHGTQPSSACPECGRSNPWYVPKCKVCGHDLYHRKADTRKMYQ